MKGYIVHIEKETLENTDYRKVLYTTHKSQLVVMNIKPGDEIGEEVHKLDQFIRVEEGECTVLLNGEENLLQADHAVVIPEGVSHNVINTGSTDLKIYSIYTPPEHKDGTVHKTKEEEQEEHFDGIVSE